MPYFKLQQPSPTSLHPRNIYPALSFSIAHIIIFAGY